MKMYYFTITSLLVLLIGITSCSNEETKAQNQIAARPTVPIQNREVQIGAQIWMTKNLNVSRYRNGDPIPQVTDPMQWENMTTGAWCYYNSDPANGRIYGKLYNWYAVTDPRGIAPTGWHVPTDAEWSSIINYLDSDAQGGNIVNVAGGKMKTTGTSLWLSPNTAATNVSGFTSLPGGCRYDGGSFNLVGRSGIWWSSSENNTSSAWYRGLGYTSGNAGRGNFSKRSGFSVRCLRD